MVPPIMTTVAHFQGGGLSVVLPIELDQARKKETELHNKRARIEMVVARYYDERLREAALGEKRARAETVAVRLIAEQERDAAATSIQAPWRTAVFRARFARACALRAARELRLARAAHKIGALWKRYAQRHTTVLDKARLCEAARDSAFYTLRLSRSRKQPAGAAGQQAIDSSWPLEVQGCNLPLGEAPAGQVGSVRAGEEFASVCGFSAAFGPLLFQHARTTVYGGKLLDGTAELPPAHIAFVLKAYWEKEMASFDAEERFFRLASKSGSDGIGRAELRPFILAIAERHADLSALSPDEIVLYVETVIAAVFYKHSRCGKILLSDLRGNAFVTSLNAVGRLEESMEDSEHFSFARHEKIRGEFLALCGEGWGVDECALRRYRRDGDNGTTVGPARAERVLKAAPRLFPRNTPTGGFTSAGAQGRHTLDYEAWVSFFLCEEALMAGTCSEREVRYCFAVMDDTGGGTLGLTEITPFYQDMIWEFIFNGGDEEEEFAPVEAVVSHYFDGMGVQRGRDYITLQEMLNPANVKRAGRFFEEIFSGINLEGDHFVEGVDEDQDEDEDEDENEGEGEERCDESSPGVNNADVEHFVDANGTTHYVYSSSSPRNPEGARHDVAGVETSGYGQPPLAESYMPTPYHTESLPATVGFNTEGTRAEYVQSSPPAPRTVVGSQPGYPHPQQPPDSQWGSAPVCVDSASSWPEPTSGFPWGVSPPQQAPGFHWNVPPPMATLGFQWGPPPPQQAPGVQWSALPPQQAPGVQWAAPSPEQAPGVQCPPPAPQQTSGVQWGAFPPQQTLGVQWSALPRQQVPGVQWAGPSPQQAPGVQWGASPPRQAPGVQWGARPPQQAPDVQWSAFPPQQAPDVHPPPPLRPQQAPAVQWGPPPPQQPPDLQWGASPPQQTLQRGAPPV